VMDMLVNKGFINADNMWQELQALQKENDMLKEGLQAFKSESEWLHSEVQALQKENGMLKEGLQVFKNEYEKLQNELKAKPKGKH
jgi:predicted nuclease with TOPRIM domain